MSSNATPTTTSGPPTIATQQPQSQPPLPPPQTFDILPPLHALLSRLEPSLNLYTPDTTHSPSPNPSTTANNTSAANKDTLPYKDLATASQFLKARIRKAMTELGGLADMDRSVEEQEEEIRRLEERIEGQREVLRRLGGVVDGQSSGVKKEEEAGEGV